MKTSAFLSGEAARYRRLATALVDDVRASEAFSQIADEFEARAAGCDARAADQSVDDRRTESVRLSVRAEIHLGFVGNGDARRTAVLFVNEFGPNDAPLIIAKGAEAALDSGELDVQRVWTSVLREVQELIRPDRKPGEWLN